jgi:hypothetical protein
LVKQKELNWNIEQDKVTTLKVVAGFLAIGYVDGSFDLISLKRN